MSRLVESNERDERTAGSDGAGGLYVPRANPDDPPVRRPPQGPRGPLPGPMNLGLTGRTAIVQGQVFLVAIIVIFQLGIITDALFELLSGHTGVLVWLALVSAIGFILALVITLWPRRRIEEV